MMKKRDDAVRIIKAVRKKPQRRRVAMPWLRLSLQFVDARHKALLPRYQVARWLRHALDAEKVKGAELTVRIVGLDEGHMLNHEYRHKDYATNVLTFDYAQAPMVAADLVICAPVVEREAREQGKTVNAHYAHLLVHGALHAQGWDHERDDEARAMEQRETEVLARLGFGNPY